ncbi:MAG: oxidoreductase [Candidatus Hydrogenedentota bacterium]
MPEQWDVDQIPDQSGKTVVVTGANSGIGYEAAKVLAAKGAQVIFACRNMDKAKAAVASLHEEVSDANVDVMELNLASLDSIRSFADAYRARFDSLHVLCNNAGVMALPKRTTDDGFEMQLGTNHFGHFALTGLLLEPLLNAGDARVVSVSSIAHRTGKMNFDDLQSEQKYQKWVAYGQSKLANLLFIFELNRRAAAAKADLIAAAAHPGYAATKLQSAGPEMSGSAVSKLFWAFANQTFAQSQHAGSWPTLFAVTDPSVRGGDYIGPSAMMEARGLPKKVDSNNRSKKTDDWKRLWDISEELTSVSYEFPSV